MAKKPPKPPPLPGQATGPRVKKPKKERGRQTSGKIPMFNIEGGLSPGVPDAAKIEIATAIMAHSQLDVTLEWYIWDLIGLSYDDGRLLTTVDLRAKIEIARTITKRYEISLPEVPAKTPGLWKVIEDVSAARNLMAHGVWGMHRLTIPMVSSFRLNAEEPDRVVSEAFPIHRLQAVARQRERARDHLLRMSADARALRQKLSQQSQTESPKPDEGS